MGHQRLIFTLAGAAAVASVQLTTESDLLNSAFGALVSPAMAEQHGGTLVVGWDQVPRHLNPAVQSGVATAMPGAQVFASLLRYDDEWNPQPYLAESWEVSEDGLEVTVRLVEGALFHDGEPVTSSDVAFSLETVKQYHPFQTMFAPVDRVETPDERTAVFHLSHPHPAIILAMSPPLLPILPEHVYGDGQDVSAHPRNSDNPIGAGPFRVVEFNPDERIVLERFEDYFIEDRPFLDRVIVNTIPDASSLVLSLETAELHMLPLLASPQHISRLGRDEAINVTDRGYEAIGPLNWLAFNTAREPLDDPRVRQAIAHAIDRDFFIDALMQGTAQPANTPLMPGSPFHHDGIGDYAFDVDRANELLDEAGYERGSDGTRFSLTIDFIPGWPDLQRNAAEMIRSQLRAVGIDVSVRSAPDFPTWADRVGGHNFDLTMDIVFNWSDPVIGVHRTYLSSNIRPGVIWTNTQSYSNERVDELLEAAATETDEDARRELYREFQEIVHEDLPLYFFNVIPYHTAYRDVVGNPPLTVWGPLSPFDEVYLTE